MSKKTSLDRSFEAALRAAAKGGGPDIAFGAVRARIGRGKTHVRYVGDARVEITYKVMKADEAGGALRPLYKVVVIIKSGDKKMKHKLTVGGATTWHEEHVSPSAPEAIDAIAGSAIRFTTTPDEDVPSMVADLVNFATQGALKENGDYEVRRSK